MKPQSVKFPEFKKFEDMEPEERVEWENFFKGAEKYKNNPINMNPNPEDCLSASEALFAFCGWLTGRREVTTMSAAHECSCVAELIQEFINRHNLENPRNGWEDNIIPENKGENNE